MSDKITYYLHIGMPKTGTSSLQYFLSYNFDQLKSKGVLYPKTGRGDFNHHHSVRFSCAGFFSRFIIVILKLGGVKIPFWFPKKYSKDDLVKALGIEVEGARAEKIILSSEWMSVLMPTDSIKNLASVFGANIVKPVIYVRRQDEAIQSLYAQFVKDRNIRTSFKFNYSVLVRLPIFDFHLQYLRWGSVFKKENIIIRTFDQLEGGDIKCDFLSTLGIDGHGLSFATENKNPHLSSANIEILRQANARGMPYGEFKVLMARLSENGGRGFDFLTTKERVKINKRFESSNSRLALEYFNRNELFLQYPPPQ